MSINRAEVLSALKQLSEQQELQVTIVESAKNTAVIAAAAFTGSMLGGPIGLAIGGTLASITTAFRGYKKYKSLAEIIMYDMTVEQQTKLATSVMGIIKGFGAQDAVTLLAILANNGNLQTLVLKEVGLFLKNEMQLSLMGS